MALIARTGIRKGNRKPRRKPSADVPTTKETAADKARRLAEEAQRRQQAEAADRARQAQKAAEERQRRDAATEAEAAKNIGKIYETKYADKIEAAAKAGQRSILLEICRFRGYHPDLEKAVPAAPPRDRAVIRHLPEYLKAEGFTVDLKHENMTFGEHCDNIFTLTVYW
jgi:hypothetical protein